VLGVTVVVMLFVAAQPGRDPGHWWGAALAAAMFLKDYQLERLQSFRDPFANALTTAFQTVQGLLALGLGGSSAAASEIAPPPGASSSRMPTTTTSSR